MKRKMYVYGVAGLAAAAVGASAAGGLFSGSDEGEQAQASTTLAGQSGAVAPPVKAPAVVPPKVAAPVVPVVPAVPAAKPAPVAKVATVKPKTVKRDYQPVVQRKANPVRKATTSAPKIMRAAAATPAVRPIVLVLPMQPPVTKPVDNSVTEAKKRLDAAEEALSKAKGLVDQAEDQVEKAESDVKKTKEELNKAKKTKNDKGKHDPRKQDKDKNKKDDDKKDDKAKHDGKAKQVVKPVGKPKPVTDGKKDSNKVEVSLSSKDVKPGQTRTITKTTPDGSASSTVTVTRGAGA